MKKSGAIAFIVVVAILVIGAGFWKWKNVENEQVFCIDHSRDDHNNGGDYPEKHESNNCSTEAVFTVEPNTIPAPIGIANPAGLKIVL